MFGGKDMVKIKCADAEAICGDTASDEQVDVDEKWYVTSLDRCRFRIHLTPWL
jgi:hypothetical protein